jgi:hypothetical protein
MLTPYDAEEGEELPEVVLQDYLDDAFAQVTHHSPSTPHPTHNISPFPLNTSFPEIFPPSSKYFTLSTNLLVLPFKISARTVSYPLRPFSLPDWV